MTKAEIAAKEAADKAAKLAAENEAAAKAKAEAEAAEAAKKAAEPKSEKLTALRADLLATKTAVKSLAADSPEEDAAFTKIYKLGEDIKAEIAEIGKQKAAAEQKEREAVVIAEFDAAVQASKDSDKVAASDASAEDKNAAYAHAQSLRETICNKLLGKAKPVSGGTGTASKGTAGQTTKEILDLITANRAAGMNDADNKKAVANAGYAVGTIWGILDKFKKENGAKA